MIAYRYKLYRNKRLKKLESTTAICCNIYNHCIALHRRFYRRFKQHLNKYALQRHITKLKKTSRFQFWNQVNSQCIQEITERIEKGYQAFFKRDNKRPPTFRSRSKYKSFTLKNSGWKYLGGNKLKIGCHTYKFANSREFLGKPKTLTVKRDQVGDWFVTVVTGGRMPAKQKPKTGKSAGFDFGCTTFLTVSDGSEIKSPLFFKQSRKEIAKASRSISRKVKGSNNRKKAKKTLARVHRRVANRRDDWQWKLANHLADQFDELCFEDLDMKSMSQEHGKKVSDLGFADFLHKLDSICQRHDKQVVKINRWFPSSKTCSDCGFVKHDLGKYERSWICPQCGADHDRDFNASVNIHAVGASTAKAESVNPAFAGNFL